MSTEMLHGMKKRYFCSKCDSDAIIYLVEPSGPACHTGEKVCFHHELK